MRILMIDGGAGERARCVAEQAQEHMRTLDDAIEFVDMAASDPHLLDAIAECNGAVLFFESDKSLPPDMQNLLTEMNYLTRMPRFFDKKALVISVADASQPASTVADALRGWGFNRCDVLTLQKPVDDTIRRTAQVFLLDVESRILNAPRLRPLMAFNRNRGRAARKDADRQEAIFWLESGMKGDIYFPQVRVGVFKRIAGGTGYVYGRLTGK